MRKYKFTDIEPYFLGKLTNLRKLLDSGYRFEAAILSLCYIDALSGLFMEGVGTKQKFMNLIFLHGVVDNLRWDKVNLAEFKKIDTEEDLKSKECPTCYEKVKQYIEKNICQYEYSSSTQCREKDKSLPDVIKDIRVFSDGNLCKCNIISKALLKCLKDSTYGGILYNKYRCEGVHRGKFDELWDSLSHHFDGPFYVSIEDSLPDFSIPPEFIIKTFEQCMVGLKKWECDDTG